VQSTAPAAKRVVFFVFVTVFLDLVGFGIVAPQLPIYVRDLGGSPQTVGFLFSSFAGTQLIATPILGRLSDRRGRRRVILLSLFGNALAMTLFATAIQAHLLWLLFVSRILAGATAGNLAACQAAIADVTSGDDRAKGMGRLGAGIGLGMVLGPVIGGWASALGSSAPPLVAAALATTDLIAASFLMPETNPREVREAQAAQTKDARSLAQVLRDPRLLAILAVYFLTFLYMTNLQVALPLLCEQRLGWNQNAIGNVFGAFGGLMLLIQGVFLAPLVRTFGARNLVISGALSSMAGLLLIASADGLPMLAGGLALLGTGLGVTNPVLSTLASELAGPSRQGAVLGVAQSSGGLARTVGPTGVGFLYEHVGPGASFVGGAMSALLALTIAVAIRGAKTTRDAIRERI
jgi:MFS family permease